ncbi:Glycyl-glycine endopeptidase ALE-1 [Hondaea fermentalgiana]|uniref:Glycyl-glycine endopeptidase ALE-1 n=1 Tax=Hondaea fermentalgiana TaxID=2315210 RepID=A0A2R5GCH6_9STRA|nr:Glycyl-glycine endopeptidase ALE-1 [Hondaea fermentalgiana]|eukprot:GBG28049.1 Glycyl-glycine endopeptidase ALE-1 [Hondaea fermentalgiana]
MSAARVANYVEESMPGCHVARFAADWLVDVDTELDDETFGVRLDQVPEISIDPESRLLSVINSDPERCKSFNLTLSGACLPARNGDGVALAQGTAQDADGQQTPCVSFVLVVKPKQMMDVCFVGALPDAETNADGATDLASDVHYCPLELPKTSYETAPIVSFPLGGPGPYLCSQGACGHFTHYFPGNCFAVDLECEVGTPVLAVGSGVIVGLQQDESVEGIHARNLFHWNSLQLQLDAGGVVEYVHIRKSSAAVAIGDRVEDGALLCESGAVGFAPRPHLHIQMLPSTAADAASIPFRISCCKVDLNDAKDDVSPQVCQAALVATLRADPDGQALRSSLRARLAQHPGRRPRLRHGRKWATNGGGSAEPALLRELAETQRRYVAERRAKREERRAKRKRERVRRGKPLVPEAFSRELAKFDKPAGLDADVTKELTQTRMRTYLGSFEKHQNILQHLLPPISSEYKAYLTRVGFARNEMTLEPIERSCACLGCQHLQPGGWGKQLATALPYRAGKGPVVRNLTLRAAQMIGQIYTKDNASKYCARSFSIAMAAKRLVEHSSEKEGGYESVNALKLRCVAIGIVRLEMGRRLVQNRCLPAIEPRHEEQTREIFRTIEARQFSGRINKLFIQFLYDNFAEAKEEDKIDPLTWDELLHGHRHVGSPGSRPHVLGARALFEGRCTGYLKKATFSSEDFALFT